MIQYVPTTTDRAPLPGSYQDEPRYLGYRQSDTTKPYAKFFRPDCLPVQDHVREVLIAGMAPTEYAYDLQDAARIMSRPGYQRMETGYTRVPAGWIIHVLTDMPNVTAEMWDWWFGWHSCESARYKLWHPDAHQFTAVGENRSTNRSLTDRQRYIDNVSYADEYVGGTMQRLAIRFVDPTKLGFDEPAPGNTVICARVGLSQYAVAVGWLIHQIRPTDHGCEMRSRFFLNDSEILSLPAHSAPGPGSRLLTRKASRKLGDTVLPHVVSRVMGPNVGYDMIVHCAAEMNHLASFLPDLHREFEGSP